MRCHVTTSEAGGERRVGDHPLEERLALSEMCCVSGFLSAWFSSADMVCGDVRVSGRGRDVEDEHEAIRSTERGESTGIRV